MGENGKRDSAWRLIRACGQKRKRAAGNSGGLGTRWKLARQNFPRQLVQHCLTWDTHPGSAVSPQRLLAPSPLLCSCRAPLVHIGPLPEESGAPRTRHVPQRSPQPPPLRATAWAAHTLDRNSPAPSRICRFPLTAALHPASRTRTSVQRSRPPPPPPPPRAGTRRPHPPRPANAGPNRRCSPSSYRQHRAGRRRPAPILAPPIWPRPAHLGPSPLAPGAELGALQQVGRLLALVGRTLVVSCILVRRPQRCRTFLPPCAACRRTGGANFRNKSPFAL